MLTFSALPPGLTSQMDEHLKAFAYFFTLDTRRYIQQLLTFQSHIHSYVALYHLGWPWRLMSFQKFQSVSSLVALEDKSNNYSPSTLRLTHARSGWLTIVVWHIVKRCTVVKVVWYAPTKNVFWGQLFLWCYGRGKMARELNLSLILIQCSSIQADLTDGWAFEIFGFFTLH